MPLRKIHALSALILAAFAGTDSGYIWAYKENITITIEKVEQHLELLCDVVETFAAQEQELEIYKLNGNMTEKKT
jgi:hypothetical protein